MRKSVAFSRQGNAAVAYELADAGLSIFPTRNKVPLIKDWRMRATFELDQVDDWWRQYPDAAPGIECEASGIFVIDCDRHGGPDGVAAFEALCADRKLPPHPVVATPSGGEHHYFLQANEGKPLGNGSGRLPSGIDVRGVGGFIIGPGSVRADGKRWCPVEGTPDLCVAFQTESLPALPRWLQSMLRPPAHRRVPTSFHPRTDDEERVLQALKHIPSDHRETWWRVGAAIKSHFGEAGRVIWDNWSATSKKYGERVQDSVWRSFHRGGLGLGSIFHIAKQHAHAG